MACRGDRHALRVSYGRAKLGDRYSGTTEAPVAAFPHWRWANFGSTGYVDGIYTATGQYGEPPSSITVTVTLIDDVVTAVEVTPHATNPTSLDLQRCFAEAVSAVVGKPIDEVNVGRLAGSSGTPEGFNAAIQQIKEQARKTGNTADTCQLTAR